MDFEHSLTSKSTIKKMKSYNFEEDGITDDVIKKAQKHTPDNPLFISGRFCDFKIFKSEGKIRLYMFHSFDSFVEIKESEKQLKVKP